MAIQAIIGYAWMAFGAYWLVSAFLIKRAVRRQSIGSRAIQTIGTIAGFVFIFDDHLNLGPLGQRIVPASAAAGYAGLAFTVAGIAFAVWARVHLGGNWSGSVTVKKDHTLIRTGPYSLVRHPIYTGILFAACGGAIAIGRIRCFIGLGVLLATLRVKSLLEERFMGEQFGTQYSSYQREVKALVPFIW